MATWRETTRTSPSNPRGRSSRTSAQRDADHHDLQRGSARLVLRREQHGDGGGRGGPHAPHQHRAQDRAAIVARPADDQHGPDLEGKDRHVVVRRDEADEMRMHGAGQAHDAATDRESLQAELDRVLAERERCRLVLADGAQHAAPRTAHQAFERQIDSGHHEDEDAEIEQAEGEGLSGKIGERTRDEPDAEWPAGHRLQIERAQLHHHRGAEGGDGEIVGAQADGERADQEGDHSRRHRAAQPADHNRQFEAAQVAG